MTMCLHDSQSFHGKNLEVNLCFYVVRYNCAISGTIEFKAHLGLLG